MYDTEKTEREADDFLSQLPRPAGWHLLIALPEVEEKTKGGIYRPDKTREREETAAIVGFVMKMGPDCYTNKMVFPTGPWCKEKEWVVFRPYSGLRLVIYGKEFRLLKDSEIDAVVDDPRGIVRSNKA